MSAHDFWPKFTVEKEGCIFSDQG